MLNLNNYADSTTYNKFYHKKKNLWPKTLLEREALVMFF